jgi:hypothetical protein
MTFFAHNFFSHASCRLGVKNVAKILVLGGGAESNAKTASFYEVGKCPNLRFRGVTAKTKHITCDVDTVDSG